MKPNKQILLIIGQVWPEPNSSAAGTRTLQLIKIFQKKLSEINSQINSQINFEIHFASAAQDSPFMSDLNEIGIKKHPITLNCTSFDQFINTLNPTIVMFDRFMTEEQFGWRVTEQCPNALKILDTQDLHCLRLARHAAVKENRHFNTDDLYSDTAKREIAAILRCDLSLIISEFEMSLLHTFFKIDPTLLHYIPILVNFDQSTITQDWHDFESRNNFVFIGNFIHAPNLDAVRYLKSHIWPLIHTQLPHSNLHIYGAYPSQKVLQLDNKKECFRIMGRAENAQDIVKSARVMLSPLRFGAGIKGKLLEAMECGTPSITSHIGAEAMYGTLPWNGFIEDDPQEFANKAVLLYQDKDAWHQAQKNGLNLLKKRYDQVLFEENLISRILALKSLLNQHRKQNFIGALLQHHTLMGTKYMSKWIHLKNS